MSIGGSILVGNKNIDGNFVEDRNEQHFEGLDFRIKIETLPNEDYSARLFFINKNDDNEIPIPDGIVCKDVTLRNEVIKYPLPLTNYFLINHPLKYQITYKGEKIYQLNSEKKIVVHNFKKKHKDKDMVDLIKNLKLEDK
ncbi:12496_t:CDS:1 [Entrophospora sp. SA101]|nr:11669_t:CDS:1 [Entrophospora sp. SA101]CAJ0635649.1 9123_t:CDS:1 [Entrophospora sp. SA101]CAJ0752570.1 22188_t:CDS:1 [Entrophospora sp. SA101]CAJ0753970.1 12496_t:CDS:1 [Entrophospora sp. SA101]CAJ0825801.1 17044_t:CDS:1 [Entrophospora sp. SA101]